MSYKILESRSPQGLVSKVNELITEGWEVVGSHQVVVSHELKRFGGNIHKDTIFTTEYTQTMVKKETDKKELLTEDEILKRGFM